VKNRWYTSVKDRLAEIEGISNSSVAQHSPALLPWSSPAMMDFSTIPPLLEHRQLMKK
jgi:hypothetical protein